MTHIDLKNVRLEFPIFDKVSRSVRTQIAQISGRKAPSDIKNFKALNDVTVSLKAGDRVGLLGNNGAGKSTFLKLLAGVYQPTSGEISIEGEISSLFNVSVGMDPTANGYENIPLLMAARSIPLSQKAEIVEEVEKFSQLGDALFRPVRTYSSGMRLRLAFAVATAKSSEILLLDEVVGVGDKNFKNRSKERIQEISSTAGILVVASHANGFLQSHCERGLVFEEGRIIFDGPIQEAIDFHTN